jgi:hypothetical protein
MAKRRDKKAMRAAAVDLLARDSAPAERWERIGPNGERLGHGVEFEITTLDNSSGGVR